MLGLSKRWTARNACGPSRFRSSFPESRRSFDTEVRNHKQPRAPQRVAPAANTSVDLPWDRALVGRQAILSRNRSVWAYQLLYRSSSQQRADFDDPHHATATVLLNTFVELGLERVVGAHPMLIEFPKVAVLENYASLVSSDRVILQIAAESNPEAHMIGALRFLRAKGFRIGVNGVVAGDHPSPLTEVTDVVKIDVNAYDADALKKLVDRFHLRGVRMIANKVETFSQYELCERIGFDYFQGFFLERPQIVEGRRPSAGAHKTFELLHVLNDSASTIDDIERLAVADIAFSYRLLRVLNSAAFGLRQRVESVRQAIVMMGLDNLRKWTMVLSVSSQTNKPTELTRIALIRAQMCENLGRALRQPNLRLYFTVGFFSVLSALLDRPLEEALAELPLVPEVADAVLHRTGLAGEVLRCVIAYERGDWDDTRIKGLDEAQVASAWFNAVQQADQITSDAMG